MTLQTPDSLTETATQAATGAAFDFQAAFGDAWTKVADWLEAAVESLPNLIAALVVLLAFWGLAKVTRRLVKRLATKLGDQPQVNRLIAQTSYLAMLALGLVVALGVLNLNKTVTSLLAGAGIIGLALGFAFQDIAENFIAGIILSVRHQFKDGDIIETNDYMGVVDSVELRATTLRVPTGQRVLIPNADVYKSPLINYTTSGKRRVDIDVGISFGDDLEKAKQLAIEAVEGIKVRDKDQEVELYYEEFGGNSIDFVVRFWIDYSRQADFLEARSEAIMAIKKTFDENDITIPFPIRTLDFGAEASGGQDLSASLGEAGFGKSDDDV